MAGPAGARRGTIPPTSGGVGRRVPLERAEVAALWGRWGWLAALALVVAAVAVAACSGLRNGSGAPNSDRTSLLAGAVVGLQSPTPGPHGRAGATPGSTPSADTGTAPQTPTAGFAPSTPSPTPAPTRAPDDLLRFVGKSGDPLPFDYVPPDLEPLPPGTSVPDGLVMRHDAALAFAQMCAAARQDGVVFYAVSTYRSFSTQIAVYDSEVAAYGEQQASRESAVPGRSEHQLGLAVDISIPALGYQLDASLAQFPEGAWLAANAANFGFVLSYPDGKEAITGYTFEPWHFRYVGVDAAQAIAASGLTSTEVLQQWLTVDTGPTPQPAATP